MDLATEPQPFQLGTNLTYHCKYGAFPNNSFTTTCIDGGEWIPNPSKLVCRNTSDGDMKNCSLPAIVNGSIKKLLIDTENWTVMFECKEGLLLKGPAVINCNSSRIWNIDPNNIKCIGITVTENPL